MDQFKYISLIINHEQSHTHRFRPRQVLSLRNRRQEVTTPQKYDRRYRSVGINLSTKCQIRPSQKNHRFL